MRILNISGLYFVKAFQDLGHHVLSIGDLPQCDVRLERVLSLKGLLDLLNSRGFTPDVLLWCDSGKPPMVLGIENLPSVNIGYSIDQYCNPWHVPYAAAFDTMLLAQKKYLQETASLHPELMMEWFPLFATPEKDKDMGLKRDIPTCFVGTIDGRFNASRQTFYHTFRSLAPLVISKGAYVPKYNRSRIVLNQSAAGELNFRIFEAMACGAALLTEDENNGLHELFTPGKDLLVYPRGDAHAAARIAFEHLQTDTLENIARSGRDVVLKNHTSTARAKRILNQAKRLLTKKTHHARLARADKTHALLSKAYTSLALDTNLPLPDYLRNFYKERGLA